MSEEQSTYRQINEIAAALAIAQSKMEAPKQDSVNPHFRSRYASLQSVLDAVLPALTDQNVAVVQETQLEGDTLFLRTRLIHKSGQYLEAAYPVTPQQRTPQGYGSALTYARRYSLSALVGVASEADDDGQAGSTPGNGAGAPESNKPTPKPEVRKEKPRIDPPAVMPKISEAQASVIEGTLAEHEIDEHKFMNWLRANVGAASIADIAQDRYGHVMLQINKARERKNEGSS